MIYRINIHNAINYLVHRDNLIKINILSLGEKLPLLAM